MKLVIAVVQDQDASPLMDMLVDRGFRATKLATTGGFLRQGNTTLLIGTEDEDVEDVVEIIKSVCRWRTQLIPPMSVVGRSVESYVGQPVEVPVGGATIFVLDVTRFEKI
ncbi:MAG: cyclic-di-AMP receptor [Bacillota bacterium]